jgi:hypothetical protein
MTQTAPRLAAFLATMATLAVPPAASGALARIPAFETRSTDQGENSPAIGRVRTKHPPVAESIRVATERSPTFRRLVERIDASDGLVYILHGDCGLKAVRACLVQNVAVAGEHRILNIRVNANARDCSLMTSLGHELQHAVEVLSNRALRSASAIYLFYRSIGRLNRGTRTYETDAAIETGRSVREELSKSGERCLD